MHSSGFETEPSDTSGSHVGIQSVQVMGASDTSQQTPRRLKDGVPSPHCDTLSSVRTRRGEGIARGALRGENVI